MSVDFNNSEDGIKGAMNTAEKLDFLMKEVIDLRRFKEDVEMNEAPRNRKIPKYDN